MFHSTHCQLVWVFKILFAAFYLENILALWLYRSIDKHFRKNHFEDYIVERTALPSELIRDVQGQLAFEEEHPRVWPINHFPDQQINSASNSLVQKHNTAFPTERILKQVRL